MSNLSKIKIKIVTDSASDLPVELEERYHVLVLPFAITVGDKGYVERQDFTPQEFYKILVDSPKIPTTSQYTPMQFLETFETIYQEGDYTDLIFIGINSRGSNTFNNSLLARDQFYEAHPEAKSSFKIACVDSKSYSLGYGFPVAEAAKKAENGASAQEIVSYLESFFKSCRIYFAPYSLQFAKKSGRISCAAAFVGELMGLKPIITFEDGDSKILAKVRGEKSVVPAIVKMAKQNMIPHTEYAIIAGSNLAYAEQLKAEMEKAVGYPCSMLSNAGAAITINAGPDLVAVVIKDKGRQ